jgi:hypothetical protein
LRSFGKNWKGTQLVCGIQAVSTTLDLISIIPDALHLASLLPTSVAGSGADDNWVTPTGKQKIRELESIAQTLRHMIEKESRFFSCLPSTHHVPPTANSSQH